MGRVRGQARVQVSSPSSAAPLGRRHPGASWPTTALAQLALVAMVLGGCSAAKYPYAKLPDPRRSEYVIGPSDVLSIRVWHDPDLSTDAAVRPDGTITMPLVGDLVAAELTPTQLRDLIKARLAAFVRDSPTITVAVTSVNSY